MLVKCNTIISLINKLFSILIGKSSLTIYKSFVRPNLDYANIIYDKPLTESFKRKIEMVQHNAAIIIAGGIKGSSHNKVYQELALESLTNWGWSWKLIFFHKIILGLLPPALQEYLNSYSNKRTCSTRSSIQNKRKTFSARTKSFETSFFYNALKNGANLARK